MVKKKMIVGDGTKAIAPPLAFWQSIKLMKAEDELM